MYCETILCQKIYIKKTAPVSLRIFLVFSSGEREERKGSGSCIREFNFRADRLVFIWDVPLREPEISICEDCFNVRACEREVRLAEVANENVSGPLTTVVRHWGFKSVDMNYKRRQEKV